LDGNRYYAIGSPGSRSLRDPFDDDRVRGFISKLKGQIGENIFQRHVGSAAELAPSGSQEAWDVAVQQADGAYEYVQVKLYGNPHKVVALMCEVQDKVARELIKGRAGDTVHAIDFAVPADIAEKLNRLKERYPELHSMRVISIPIDAHAAADIVKEGMSNVGPEQLSHFFHELLSGAVTAGSLHAIVNGFLWCRWNRQSRASQTPRPFTLEFCRVRVAVDCRNRESNHRLATGNRCKAGSHSLVRHRATPASA
jgi:hypothetical protein